MCELGIQLELSGLFFWCNVVAAKSRKIAYDDRLGRWYCCGCGRATFASEAAALGHQSQCRGPKRITRPALQRAPALSIVTTSPATSNVIDAEYWRRRYEAEREERERLHALAYNEQEHLRIVQERKDGVSAALKGFGIAAGVLAVLGVAYFAFRPQPIPKGTKVVNIQSRGQQVGRAVKGMVSAAAAVKTAVGAVRGIREAFA
jgi:hypothetical protein